MTDQPQPCINCDHTGSGHFCSNCGQKLEIQAITWSYVASDFLDKWFGIDTKYGRTVIDLFKHPGEVIRTYLSGNKVRYVGPLGYYIVMSALLILLFEALNISIDQFLMSNTESLGMNMSEQTTQQQEFQVLVNQWMAKNFRFIGGLMVPFLALGGKIFYRKTTYLHHVITAAYFQSHTTWFSLIMLLIYKISGYNASGIVMIVTTIYLMVAYMLVFSSGKKFKGLMKGLLIWIVGYFLMMVIAMVVGVTYLILFHV